MSALDTAKEFVRIGSTAGLSKDVIDLLEKKAALLAEQVTALEKENTTLLRENRNLKLENESLKNQLPYAKPKGELSDQTTLILKYFFAKAGNRTSGQEIAHHFQITKSMADYQIDVLLKKKFIWGQGRIIIGGGVGFGDDHGHDDSPQYEISPEGRAYCVENGLAS